MAVEFTTPDPKAERPRKLAFTLDGTEYTIPEKFTAGEGLTYIHNLRNYGVDAATSWALEYALGAQGYAILLGLGQDPEQEEGFLAVVNGIVEEISGKQYRVSSGKAPVAKQSSPRPRTPKARPVR